MNQTFVAIDLETTGKYPLGAEICEIAMIKFKGEEVLGRYESLVKPLKGMNKVAEGIHGLSLESLKDAPLFQDILPEVLTFMGGAPLLGHNLPFDLAFLAHEFDQVLEGSWWGSAVHPNNFCTSLLSIQTHPKLTTHRLKYLTEYFEVECSPNHRAMQDAQACMDVFLKVTKDIGNIEELVKVQKNALAFKEFSIKVLLEKRPELKDMVEASIIDSNFELIYSKGSKKNQWRILESKGLVLKTNEKSFIVGTDLGEIQTKRFMLNKVLETRDVTVE